MDTRLATCPLAMTKKPSKRRLPHPAPQKKKHKKPPKKAEAVPAAGAGREAKGSEAAGGELRTSYR